MRVQRDRVSDMMWRAVPLASRTVRWVLLAGSGAARRRLLEVKGG